MQRHTFQIDTDTGTQGDTGVPFYGAVLQMRWNPTTVDTGADLQVGMKPRTGDTGDGWLFYDDNDVLGTDFVRAPRQPQHGSDGAVDPADTGAAFGVPVYGAGDRLRVKVIPGGAACAGTLYIWTG